MRIPLQVIGAVILMVAVSIGFTNCQQGVDFKSSSSLGTQGNPQNPPTVPPTPEDVKKTCMNSPHQNKVLSAMFPKPNLTCPWNTNGNLEPRNGYFQGRIEQTAQLDIPANATVCNVTFSFANQQFLYDDHFIFAFDDTVVASSYDYSDYLIRRNGLLAYDWSRIAGQFWDEDKTHMKEGVFCASVRDASNVEYRSTCSWPDTDQPGTIQMSFPKEVFYSVMSQAATRTSHEFKFVSIGDNDDLDCEHSKIDFQVLVEYVLPN